MIETRSVSKRLGPKQVLTGVSLSALNGEVTGFVGPNGAGKTTLMKIITGLIPADSGDAVVDGARFSGAAVPGRALGVYMSGEWLPTRRSGADHLRFVCDTQGLPSSRIRPLLEAVGMWGVHGRAIESYSLGMRQRLGIAAALVGDPANLMLDEPVNGLDPNGVIWLRGLLRAQAAEGKAVLLSSHLMAELELVADRVVVLNEGIVVRDGTLAELASSGAQPEVYIASPDLGAVVDLLRARGLSTRPEGPGALIAGASPEQVGRQVFGAGLTLSHLAPHVHSLEELFLSSTAPSRPPETAA